MHIHLDNLNYKETKGEAFGTLSIFNGILSFNVKPMKPLRIVPFYVCVSKREKGVYLWWRMFLKGETF